MFSGSQRGLRTAILILALGSAVALVSCNKKSHTPTELEAIIHAPFDDAEAELLALTMSGEIGAPPALYELVRHDLLEIRRRWAGAYPALQRISYRPPWDAGKLMMGIDPAVFERMMTGGYEWWDSLNQEFLLDSAYFYRTEQASGVMLVFGPRLNPELLRWAYRWLPGGIGWVEPIWSFYSRPNVRAYLDESDNRVYIFGDATAGCATECAFIHTWEFRSSGSSVEYIGESEGDGETVLRIRYEGRDYDRNLDFRALTVRRYRDQSLVMTGSWWRASNLHTQNTIEVPTPLHRLSMLEQNELTHLIKSLREDYPESGYYCGGFPFPEFRTEFHISGENLDLLLCSPTASNSFKDLDWFLSKLVYSHWVSP